MKEKEFEKMNKFKHDEYKRNKSETKIIIINSEIIT